MRDKIIIAVVAVSAFLLGTLMPRTPEVERNEVVIYRDTSYSRLDMGRITNLEVPEIKGVPSLMYIPEVKVRTVVKDSIRYVVLDREHKVLENDDVKVWYSGVDPTIDSLLVRRHTVIQKEPWKRHSVGLEADAGMGLSAGLIYEYNVFRWMSVSAKTGYEFYMGKPYASVGLNLRLYNW